jgi:F-type H+-transporting ATPase subunit b
MISPILTLIASSDGFDPLDVNQGGNMLWTWIIFLVTLPFAWKVVLGPVARALEERDDRARRAIEESERASREAERSRAEVEVKLGEAQASAARLLSEARERAEVREREIVEDAKREGEALRERARADIETAKQQALQAIRDEVVELSLSAAGRVLERTVDSADDRRLVTELVSSAGATRGSGGRRA